MAGLCWTRTKSDVCWRITFEDLVGTCDCTFLPYFGLIEHIYSRLTQRWHYSGSRRPVTGMLWPVPACLRIFIYTSPPKRRIFLKLEGIASQTLVVIGYWRASIELGRGYSASNTIVYRHLQIESHWQSRRNLTVGYDN